MNILSVILGVFSIVLLLIIYLKIRKVHLFIFEVRDELFKSINNLFKQKECLDSLYLDLGFRKALPATRGWAGSPDFLTVLKDAVKNDQPDIVVECSSGVSTLVLARCLKLKGSGHVYSLEHDSEYAEITRVEINRHDLHEWATVLYAPLKRYTIDGEVWNWYETNNLPKVGVGMLVIDGPPATNNLSSRYPALPLLRDIIESNTVIILDDADRVGEKEIIDKWSAKYGLNAKHIDCEKGCAILRFI